MHYTDLHIHSKYSDGILSPEEIVRISCKKGIQYISITDHDTIDSQYIIESSKNKYDTMIISGIELSTEYKGREIHILGYFIDIYNKDLISILSTIKESRIVRAKEIIRKLNTINIDISFEDIYEEGASIGRPHIAKILVNKGFAKNTKDAFQQYLVNGKPGYVDRYKINYKDALKIISMCNGISVLAHPGEVYRGISIEEIIKEFKVYGLKGLEVFHPSHSVKQTNDYYNLSKKYSLIITGGSDCHGLMHDNDLLIGTSGLDPKLTYKFLRSSYIK